MKFQYGIQMMELSFIISP